GELRPLVFAGHRSAADRHGGGGPCHAGRLSHPPSGDLRRAGRRGAVAFALLLATPPAASTYVSRRGFTGTVDFAQHLDRSLPAELRFRDERGNAVRLGDYLGTSPLGLVFSYYGCSNLCPTQIRNLAQRLAQTSGAAADQAQMLVVSIDPLD